MNILSSRLRQIILLQVLLVILAVSGCSRLPAEHEAVKAVGGYISISVNEVNDGKAHFYTFRKGGKRINFFVRTDGSGAISAYFDACFTCSKYKKGYRVEGTDIICNECSMTFRLADEKWDNSRGCSPIPLKNSIENGLLRIKEEDIEKGARIF